MGSGFFQSNTVPYANLGISTIIAGAYREANTNTKWTDLDQSDGTKEHIATRAYQGVLEEVSTATWADGATQYAVSDFGLLRETAKRISNTTRSGLISISTDKDARRTDIRGAIRPDVDLDYPIGPFLHAADASAIVLSQIDSEYDTTGPAAHPFPETAGTEPTVVAADMVDLLLNNTEIWGTSTVETLSNMLGQHSNFSSIMSAISEGSLSWQAISVPSPAFDWSSFTWTGPTTTVSASTVSASAAVTSGFTNPSTYPTDLTADTVAEPTTVTVEDNIDDAVDTYSDLVDLRFAQEEVNLQASLFSTRQMMSSVFDNALAILSANKQAQITEYDKGLRTKQAELQAQADLAHQTNLLQRNTTNAQLSLDADKANVDAFYNKHGLLLKAAELQVQSDMDYQGRLNREHIAQAEITLKASEATVTSGIQAKDLERQWVVAKYDTMIRSQIANLEAQVNRVRVKSDILKMIYDTVMAWMTARAHLMTNAGPLASVITSAAELNAKVFLASREHEMAWRRDSVQTAINYAGGIEGLAKLKWNALTQNMELYRTTINAMTGIAGGTQKPSAFQQITEVASLASGLVSTGINLGMVLS